MSDPSLHRSRRWTPANAPEGPAIQQMAERARARFAERFGGDVVPFVTFAPGRVNLIGEHTDYNEGFVLPMAIDRGVLVACRPHPADASSTSRKAGGPVIRVYSSEFDEAREYAIEGAPRPREPGWFAYVAGVAALLYERRQSTVGADMLIESNLAVGAGLSSSAALEVAVARALVQATSGEWDAVEIAKLCRRAENHYVGVPCGIMDQFTSAASVSGFAMLLDCRSMHVDRVRIPRSAVVVVIDTGVRHSLAATSDAAYHDRREACLAAVRAIRTLDHSVYSLRDVDRTKLDRVRDRLDPMMARRATHVVYENERVLSAAIALDAGDVELAGRLMNESHESLRDLYQVSGAELDLAVEAAREHPACFGARMTGAGFGGCAIALVRAADADDFIRQTRGRLKPRLPLLGELFACQPAGGARILA